MDLWRMKAVRTTARVFILAALCSASAPTQQPDAATVIGGIDAANQARYDNVLSFTATEHYAVYRGQDQTHPAAEMTVLDSYRRGVGKTYTIQSQSGSSIIIRFGLKPMLEQERTINEPANLPHSWFISANYEMKPQLGATVKMNGRDCIAVPVTARAKAPNTINGTIWVDAKDYWLVQIDGLSSKSPSAFTGDTHLMRQYALIDGFSMATHARAETNSSLIGNSVITIDYSNYQLQLKQGK
jgi:hypothetical protein